MILIYSACLAQWLARSPSNVQAKGCEFESRGGFLFFGCAHLSDIESLLLVGEDFVRCCGSVWALHRGK